MPEIQGLFYDQASLMLLAEIVEEATAAAEKQGIALPSDAKQKRMLLTERILRGIEAGETDMDRLKELPLMPQ
jgi:hypothetical protein